MEILTSYDLIIGGAVIIILSFLFSEFSRKTSIPSVLLLIALGIVIKLGIDYYHLPIFDFFPILEILGIVGLIMIVLEAALELELKREKIKPILKALVISIIGLIMSIFLAASIIEYFIPDMSYLQSLIYATPLSILSSAIIIPSVGDLKKDKKEFHIYESTFSDILGIMIFYFLLSRYEAHGVSNQSGFLDFGINLLATIAISLVGGYLLIVVFQKIKTNVKLFLLISALLLLYSIGKQMHLSALIIILVFGLLIANMKIFFSGKLSKLIDFSKANDIYKGLHTVTAESAFVVRTFFFVVFGITISLSAFTDLRVAFISVMILISIYASRYLYLKLFFGKDIIPQLFIAPRGLITVLLFYYIPDSVKNENFNEGILLFIIIASGLIMTFALIYNKQRANKAIREAKELSLGFERWKAPGLED